MLFFFMKRCIWKYKMPAVLYFRLQCIIYIFSCSIQVAKESPDSGVDNTNRTSFVDQDQDSFDDGLEEFPVIGTCVALYTFEGKASRFRAKGQVT